MSRTNSKQHLIEILDYLKYQLKNDQCTIEEIESIAEVLSKELDARGTIRDFSGFYNESESNVRNVIARRPIPKDQMPKRQVTYRFGWFSSIIPDSWRRKGDAK